MIAIIALNGVTPAALLAEAGEPVILIAVIPAPDILAKIAGYGPHVPDVGRGGPAGRFGESRIFGTDKIVLCDIRQESQSAYLQSAARFLNIAEAGDGLDINQSFGIDGQNGIFHFPEHVGPTCDDPGPVAVPSQQGHGFVGAIGIEMFKFLHVRPPALFFGRL
jgi:hypothetical protein